MLIHGIEQEHDCPNASEITLEDKGEFRIRIDGNWYYNHHKIAIWGWQTPQLPRPEKAPKIPRTYVE